MGDLNLNRLDTNKREGKILKDLEDSFALECLIKSPTRITNSSSTLIDVIRLGLTFLQRLGPIIQRSVIIA